MSGIVLVTASAAFEERIRGALPLNTANLRRIWREDFPALGLAEAVGEIVAGGPDVVVLGPGFPLQAALAVARELDQDHPEVSIILVAEPEGDLWQQALQAGVRDVVAPDAANAEIADVLDRVLRAAQRRRANLASDSLQGPSGHLITVLSPKGGSGKTTISANLAIGLAKAAPNEVCLVDLDLQFGDVPSALQLVPEQTMIDAVKAGSPLDITTLKIFLTPHPAHLYALCGAESPAEGDLVKPELVTEVLQLLRQEFRYVVVDTSAGLDEHALAAIDESTDLVLVCSMDVPSVRSLHKELTALDQLGLTSQRRLFVLNRADSRVGLDIRDIEATVGLAVDVQVPSSRMVPFSLNQGVPVMESDPRSPVARQMAGLVSHFADLPGSGGGFLRRKRT